MDLMDFNGYFGILMDLIGLKRSKSSTKVYN